MKAAKGNKEYTIDESQQKFYQDAGFNIFGDDGQLVVYGRGKTVPYEAYMKLIEEIERLQILSNERHTEIEALQVEIAALRQTKPETVKKAESKKAGE